MRLAERPPEGILPASSAASVPPNLRRRCGYVYRDGGPRRRLRVASRPGGAPLSGRRLPGAFPAPFAARRVRSRCDQQGREPSVATSSVFSGATGPRLRHGILPLSATVSGRRGEAQGRTPELSSTNVSPQVLSLWQLSLPQTSLEIQKVLTIYNGGVAYLLAALYIV